MRFKHKETGVEVEVSDIESGIGLLVVESGNYEQVAATKEGSDAGADRSTGGRTRSVSRGKRENLSDKSAE